MMHQDDPAENLFREERRTAPQIPLSTLEVVMGYMQSHTADENARIDDLKEDLRRLEEKLDRLHTSSIALTQSITVWMAAEPEKLLEKCEEMFDEAIPTAKDNPDATPAEKRKEHRRAHAKWMENVEDELNKWSTIRAKVAEWAIIGAISVVALALWQFILKGPK